MKKAKPTPVAVEFRELPIGTIRVNDWNANRMKPRAYRKLVEEIRERGFLTGILVYREGGEAGDGRTGDGRVGDGGTDAPEGQGSAAPAGRYVVVDGEHRFLAGKEAGMGTIPAFVLPRKPTRGEAIRLTLMMNSLRGTWDRDVLAENIRELLDAEGEERLRADLAELDADLDRALHDTKPTPGLTEEAKADLDKIGQELRLMEKVREMLKRALIEGKGSVQRGYMVVLDRETGREMAFLLDREGEVVREAVEHALSAQGGGNEAGTALATIAGRYLEAVGVGQGSPETVGKPAGNGPETVATAPDAPPPHAIPAGGRKGGGEA